MKSIAKYLVALLAAASLTACDSEQDSAAQAPSAEPQEPTTETIEGKVMYYSSMALPAGAQVAVQLQQVSADAPANVVAEVQMTPEGGSPFPFVIEYDPASIQPDMRYTLKATISVDDELMFASRDHIDPFGSDVGEILVRRVPKPVKTTAPDQDDRTWMLLTLAGEAAPPGADGKAVTLQFDKGAVKAGGFSGCNDYTGAYSFEGSSEHGTPITFSEVAATKRACKEGMELEQNYLQLLAAVTAYRYESGGLSLLAADEVVATFRVLEQM